MKLEKLKPGQLADVVVVRDPKDESTRDTNIQRYSDEKNTDFEWGYTGSGPTDFSINVLLHFTLGDEPFARYCCNEFRDKFIAKIPRAGGKLLKTDILEFIHHKRRYFKLDEDYREYRRNFKSYMGHEAMERWFPSHLRLVGNDDE